jgi:tetratricopeptide (TPR) repeat protein
LSTAGLEDAAAPTLPEYDIVGELGRGGMGVVYLAHHRELKRPVALKMILAGAHSDPETRSRFRREAEAIARLQHPGIVQIHDVGENAGRPFIALEYVDGSDLARQMAGTTVAPRTSAALVETLARIIHHAHERGIVHRDLTPRNVLLARTTAAGGFSFNGGSDFYEPKITDFGLAKQLDSDIHQTHTGVVMGTPSYMSPEQAQGSSEIGPAADIHALGAILYELLTGRPPFLAETRLATLNLVIERDPVTPTQLQPRVPRDLETICLKCLAKSPSRRYATAADLADDLRRFLINEPIRARPVSRYERTLKWVHRHPTATALLGVVLLSLVTLVAGGVIYNARIRSERDRAEESFELAMRAVDEMLSEVGEVQLATEPRMEGKRRTLLAKALALQKDLLNQKSDDPRVRFETAQAHRRMADVFRQLEQHAEAIAEYDEAIELLSRLQVQSPGDSRFRKEKAHARNFQGEVHRAAGRLEQAEAAYREAAQIESELITEHGQDPTHRRDLARALDNLGIVLRERARLPEAERELRRAADLLAKLVEQFPENPAHRQHLARACLNLGTVIPSQPRIREKQAAYDRAMELFQALVDEFPEQPDYRYELSVSYNNVGNLRAEAKQFDEARALHEKAQSNLKALAADFPKVLVYRHKLAHAHNNIGYAEYDRGDFEDAINSWKQAATLLDELLKERPNVAAYLGDLGMVLMNIGLAHHKQSRSQDARTYLESAAGKLQQSLKSSGDQAVYRETLRDTYQNLAEVLVLASDHAAAASAARELAAVAPRSDRREYDAAAFLARCSGLAEKDETLEAEKRNEMALTYANESVAALRAAIDSGFDNLKQIETDKATTFQTIADRPDFLAIVRDLATKNP